MGKKTIRNSTFHRRQLRKKEQRQKLWAHRETIERAEAVYRKARYDNMRSPTLELANGEEFPIYLSYDFDAGKYSHGHNS